MGTLHCDTIFKRCHSVKQRWRYNKMLLVIPLLLAFVGLAQAQGQCPGGSLENYLLDKGESFETERASCYERLAFEFARDNCPKKSEPVGEGKCRKFGQAINFQTCTPVNVGDICDGGWTYQIESVRVKNAAIVRTKDGAKKFTFRTAMKRNSVVDVCMFGKINTARLNGNPQKLQFTAHGEIEGQNLLTQGLKIVGDLTGSGSELAFCKETGGELKADLCDNPLSASCSGLIEQSGVQNFCACTSLHVPAIPSLGPLGKLKVKTTLKVLHSPNQDDLGQCVREFNIKKLFQKEGKQALACITIPTYIPPAK